MEVFSGQPEILNRLHDAVISTTLDGVVNDCNSAAEKIYGYSREELIGKNIAVLYPEDQLCRMRQLIATVRETSRADGEFLNVTKAGKQIWIHLSVSLLRTDQNIPCGMIGFSIDITKQQQVDAARREIELLSQKARDAARVGTWYWDLKTNQLTWDEQSSRLLDLPANCDMSYDLFLSRVHPADRPRVGEVFQHTIESGEESGEGYSTEYRVIREDGRTRWLSGRGRCLRDENDVAVKILGVVTDVTDRKEAELELQRTQAKYRVLFDSPHIGVASGNLERITDSNETFCRLIGYTRQELLSGSVRLQDITPSEYHERDYVSLQELLKTGVTTPYEKEYIRSDGTCINVLLGSALISREPLEWSCFILDITQQHRALSVARSGEQLASAARMGSALAHEINNPLASLTNIMHLLRFGGDVSMRTELLVSAQEALDRVTRITRQMIGLYSQSAAISEFTIGDLLEDTLAHFLRVTVPRILLCKSETNCPLTLSRAWKMTSGN